MAAALRVRNPRGELVEASEVSASDAKNGFGRVLEQVAREGGVAITRRNEPFAVVIPIETYRRLADAEARGLDTLSDEFDALLRAMQAPGAEAAMQRAFDMTPEALGRAAVRHAAAARDQRTAVKRKPAAQFASASKPHGPAKARDAAQAGRRVPASKLVARGKRAANAAATEPAPGASSTTRHAKKARRRARA